jgi:NAD+ synthase (glutamine-hydrolysing)
MEEAVVLGGAEVIVNISSSPYQRGKIERRSNMLATRAADEVAAVAFVNQVGGQDELLFDGHSMILDASGATLARGKGFAEDFIVADIDADAIFRDRLHDPRRRVPPADGAQDGPVDRLILRRAPRHATRRASPPAGDRAEIVGDGDVREVYDGLVLGTRDYVRKNGFDTAVIGVSGGIDSALTAIIAVDALGATHVKGVRMPSRYTSRQSMDDAAALTAALGVAHLTIPIDEAVRALEKALVPAFRSTRRDVTEENIQARVRGTLLMALSNKFGWLVLATGNKSEWSVGYSTLYGDMAGGFAPLKDVPKTLVYALARHANSRRGRTVIPTSTLTRPPTAELRPHQTDQDTLPPYDLLDEILRAYVEEDNSVRDIVRRTRGARASTVQRVAEWVDRSEYKRRQGPPGIKITPRAFGKDRRLPITNRYREGAGGKKTPVRQGKQRRPAVRRSRPR